MSEFEGDYFEDKVEDNTKFCEFYEVQYVLFTK